MADIPGILFIFRARKREILISLRTQVGFWPKKKKVSRLYFDTGVGDGGLLKIFVFFVAWWESHFHQPEFWLGN